MAPYPSGKGAVCKTAMRRFETPRRLHIVLSGAFGSCSKSSKLTRLGSDVSIGAQFKRFLNRLHAVAAYHTNQLEGERDGRTAFPDVYSDQVCAHAEVPTREAVSSGP